MFLIGGAAKLIRVFGEATRLKLPDSMWRLSWWLLMAIAGMVELVVGLFVVRVGEGSSSSGAVLAVVVGRVDFVLGYGLAFGGEGVVFMIRLVVG